MTTDSDIGRRVATLRARLGISQDAVADWMGAGWSQATVWGIESGKRRLRASEMPELCSLLSTTADYLLGMATERIPGADAKLGRLVRIAALASHEPEPGCSCAECEPEFYGMRICRICGNKRCPHAASHRYQCSGSNESGQEPVLASNESMPAPHLSETHESREDNR